MPRGRPRRSRGGRGSGRASHGGARTVASQLMRTPKPSRGRGRGRGRTPRSSTASRAPPPSRRKPWEDNGSDDDKPDFYSDDSDDSDRDSLFHSDNGESSDLDLPPPRKRRKGTAVAGLEAEADDSDAVSVGSESELSLESNLEEEGGSLSCPWVDGPDDMEMLLLPMSSEDLLISNEYLFDALEVYEICRRYGSTIKISPFLFEDFCAALISIEQSKMLAEIHVQLIKLILKEEEQEDVIFSPMDQRDCFNITFHLLDAMTYAEILRQYLESDPTRFPPEVVEIINANNYPFVGVEQRLTVLKWLCECFLQSSAFRGELKAEGQLVHDEHCRDCGKPGQLLCCDGCSAAYHLECVVPKLSAVPQNQWFCCICIVHQVKGVFDCISPLEKQGQSIRQETIGYDRHGRRYWFLVRRIIVQDDDSGQLWYYSSAQQFRQLAGMLDAKEVEWRLCTSLNEMFPDIIRQMKITAELTEKRKPKDTRSYLAIENDKIMEQLKEELKKPEAKKQESDNKVQLYVHTPCTLTSRLNDVLNSKHVSVNIFESLASDGPPHLTAADKLEPNFLYKLGMDEEISKTSKTQPLHHGYKRYVNQYSSNDYAKTPYARAQERQRQNYMANRFSLQEEGEFQWPLPGPGASKCNIPDLYGDERSFARLMSVCLSKLHQAIPTVMMHRRWLKEMAPGFRSSVEVAKTPKGLAEQLSLLEGCMRRPLLSATWRESLGHARLVRSTPDDREQRQKIEKKKKAENHELLAADPNDDECGIVWVKYTKLDGPPKHQVWKMKDEQYRVNGFRQLGGWLWVSSNRCARMARQQTTPSGNQLGKQKRLEGFINKYRGKREEQQKLELRRRGRDAQKECYSSSCRSGVPLFPVSGPSSSFQSCYSHSCRVAQSLATEPLPLDTQSVVKVVPPSMFRKQAEPGIGRDKPYPLPKPHMFRCCGGHQSVLVLPKHRLRRMARQGGTRKKPVPGFSSVAKSNQSVWPYPCSRPLFQTCWRYKLRTAQSFHTVALLFRMLYCNIRWIELAEEAPKDKKLEIAHDEYTETRQVIEHVELGPFGLSSRYKFKAFLEPVDELTDPEDALDRKDPGYRSSGRSLPRSGNGRSLRQTPSTSKKLSAAINSTKKAVTQETMKMYWSPESDLKLWEVLNYWKDWHKQQSMARSLAATQTKKTVPTVIQKKPLTPLQNTTTVHVPTPVSVSKAPVRNSPHATFVVSAPSASSLRGRGALKVTPRLHPLSNAGRVVHERPSPIRYGSGRSMIGRTGVMARPLSAKQQSSRFTPSENRDYGELRPLSIVQNEPPSPERYDEGRPPSRGYEHDHFHYTARPPAMFRRRPPTATRSEGPATVRVFAKAPGSSVVRHPGGIRLEQQRNTPRALGVNQNGQVMYAPGSSRGRGQRLFRRGRPPGASLVTRDRGPRFGGQMSPSPSPPLLHAESGSRFPLRPTSRSALSPAEAPPISVVKRGGTYGGARAKWSRGSGGRASLKLSPDFLNEPLRNDGFSDASGSRGSYRHFGSENEEDIDVESFEDMHGDESPPPPTGRMLPNYSTSRFFGKKQQPVVSAPKRQPYGTPTSERRMVERKPLTPLSPAQRRTAFFELKNKRIIEQRPRPTPETQEQLRIRLERAEKERLERETERKRYNLCRQVLNDVVKTVVDGEKAEYRKNHKLFRREYDKVYRQKRKAQKELDIAVGERIAHIRKEIIKRRLLLEQRAEKEAGLRVSTLRKTKGSSAAADLPVRYGGKRPLSERLIGAPPFGQHAREVEPPSKKLKTQFEPSTWQPPKATASLASTNHRSGLKTHAPLIMHTGGDAPKTLTDEKQLHCICKTKYDPQQFYVGCDLCSRWFHGRCVGVSEKQSKHMDSWICADCAAEQQDSQKELYCVCRTPYDETQFYVGCDGCEGWFHPRCVGITVEEAESMSEYHCPNCLAAQGLNVSSLTLSREDYPRLWRLFEALQEHRTSWPFRDPVDPDKYPTYYAVVKQPMDLKTVQKKLESLEYHRLQDFVTDISRIFDNARLFNPKDSAIYSCAVILEKRFRENLQSVKDEMNEDVEEVQESDVVPQPDILAITEESLDDIPAEQIVVVDEDFSLQPGHSVAYEVNL